MTTNQEPTVESPESYYTFAVWKKGAWHFPLRHFESIGSARKASLQHNGGAVMLLRVDYTIMSFRQA